MHLNNPKIKDALGFTKKASEAMCNAAIERQALPGLEWQAGKKRKGRFYMQYNDPQAGKVLLVVIPAYKGCDVISC